MVLNKNLKSAFHTVNVGGAFYFMGKFIDLTNKIFGRLTVMEYHSKSKYGYVLWNCQCECGNTKIVSSGHLINNQTISCGCWPKERCSKLNLTHGEALKTKEYNSWMCMKARCANKNNARYKYYGGRGITVCGRWINSFENFLADMGRAPSSKHTLDRYPNKNGNYEPGNVRWATPKEQAQNRNKPFTF